MNPAEYQGRSVLSPAYKDRWIATYQAVAPGELELRQMLETLVWGRQPDVVIDGVPYRGEVSDQATHSAVATVSGVDTLLSRLAALHAGMVSMATPGDGQAASLGGSRRERYVFSRRALIAVLDALAGASLCDPRSGELRSFGDAPAAIAADAIYRVYVDPIRDAADRARVLQLLETLGLRRESWALELGS